MKEMLKKQALLPVHTVAELLSYDPDTGALTWLEREPRHFPATPHQAMKCKSWNAAWAGKPALCQVHSCGYHVGEIFSRPFRAHRVAWALFYGEWPDRLIDHVNGRRTDNRISNLRLASPRQNSTNTSPWGSSRYLGVSKISRSGRFGVKIKHDGRSISLGNFDREEVAAHVYNLYAAALHKEFANLNDVGPDLLPGELEAIKRRADQLGLTFKG